VSRPTELAPHGGPTGSSPPPPCLAVSLLLVCVPRTLTFNTQTSSKEQAMGGRRGWEDFATKLDKCLEPSSRDWRRGH
jgi:hypothetical protein